MQTPVLLFVARVSVHMGVKRHKRLGVQIPKSVPLTLDETNGRTYMQKRVKLQVNRYTHTLCMLLYVLRGSRMWDEITMEEDKICEGRF